MNDMVDRPNHHFTTLPDGSVVESIHLLAGVLTPDEFKGYCKGNMLKYLMRCHKKNGTEDEYKACKYAEFLKDHLNGIEEQDF